MRRCALASALHRSALVAKKDRITRTKGAYRISEGSFFRFVLRGSDGDEQGERNAKSDDVGRPEDQAGAAECCAALR